MGTIFSRSRALSILILAGALSGMMGAGSGNAFAQKVTEASSAVVSPNPDLSSIDAQRGAFDRFLDSHPEIRDEVLSNPSVLRSPRWVQMYPELEAFMESHPQIKTDPRAFVSSRPLPRQLEVNRGLGPLIPFAVFLSVLLGFLWIIRTLVENRRWNQSFKMHQELHTRLIEKFAAGEDFGAYLQSDAGRRLLEWAPPALDTASRGGVNPVARILWSVQAGVVLLLVGVGLLVIRGQLGERDLAPMLVFGTLGVTLGVGFIVSALVSYRLSQHLGLITPTTPAADALVKH